MLDRRGLLASFAGGALAAALAPTALARELTAVPAPDRELRVPVRGGSIYVRVNGPLDGPRAPVLMIHGGPGGSHAGFLPGLEMASERAVILYDQLDCGFSDHPNDPANWTVERFVSEVDAIRAALNLSRLHVHGHSWGGTVALEYAARQPAGLKSLILQGPLISTRLWEKSTGERLKSLPPDVAKTIRESEASGHTETPEYARAMDVFYAHFMAHRLPPDWTRAYREKQGATAFNPRLYLTMWGPSEVSSSGTLRTYDGEPLLPKIAAPTLVMCGELDEMSPKYCADVARRIKGATTAVIPGAGHAAQVDDPVAWLNFVRAHLAKND